MKHEKERSANEKGEEEEEIEQETMVVGIAVS